MCFSFAFSLILWLLVCSVFPLISLELVCMCVPKSVFDYYCVNGSLTLKSTAVTVYLLFPDSLPSTLSQSIH